MKRLQQLEARYQQRGYKKMKRPAAAKSKSQKKQKKTEKQEKKDDDDVARKGHGGKAKGKGKGKKGKGKGKGKKPREPKEKKPVKASAKAGAKRKSQPSGAKSTFARRNQSKKEPMASFWRALRDAFEATIEPCVRAPSKLEEGLRACKGISLKKLPSEKIVAFRNHGCPFHTPQNTHFFS